MANVNDIKNLYLQGIQASALYLGNTKLWPTGLPVGTVYDFSYTGTVQEVTLPSGYYFLQCWGAQGGSVYDYYQDLKESGGYGGYSEGVLHLIEEKTLYVFVGGQPAGVITDVEASGDTRINGGWNGGGSSYAKSTYGSGYSHAAPGGGATDFSTVSSNMSYANGVTNRDSSSLDSRFLVAGGGGGSSFLCQEDSDEVTRGGAGGGTNSERYTATQTSGYRIGIGEPSINNYNFAGGGGGGGWYGGKSTESDTSTSVYGDGGSGYVCVTPVNGRLLLQSGTTISGSQRLPRPSGNGSSIGHIGNGYAKITVCNPDGTYPKPETTLNVTWSGDWTQSEQVQAVDGVQYSSNNHTDNSSSVIRCTFAGVTSITFSCYSYGESCCDYLTVGNLDSPCQRGSGKTTVKNTTTDITYTCDTGDHYVEFCYSKDGSVSTSPDEAIVYINSVTLA